MSVSVVTQPDLQYAVNLDQADASTLYIGMAPIGSPESEPVWQIRRMATSGTVSSIKWADGDQQFDNVWNNRASLTFA